MEINVKLKGKIKANGIYYPVSNTVTVQKGSMVRQKTAPHFIGSSQEYTREQLMKEGIISNFTFTRDYKFDSPSLASSVILGRSSNGHVDWIDNRGIELNSITKGKENTYTANKSTPTEQKIVYDVILLCQQEADSKIDEITNKVRLRLKGSKENLYEDLTQYVNEIESIRENATTKDNVIRMFGKMLEEYMSNLDK